MKKRILTKNHRIYVSGVRFTVVKTGLVMQKYLNGNLNLGTNLEKKYAKAENATLSEDDIEKYMAQPEEEEQK